MSDNNSTKKGTIIYNDLLDKCKRMDDAQFGRTMRLILQYAEEQQLPDLDDEDPFIATIFEFVRPSIVITSYSIHYTKLYESTRKV